MSQLCLFETLCISYMTYNRKKARVLDKLTGRHPIKKFPAFYEIRRFITVITGARYGT
jgi:hypothetical protein